MAFETPVLFLVFNRPDQTEEVFERIRQLKPKYLFVAADGARGDRHDEIRKCERVREIVLNGVDWDCDLRTLFRSSNLGCGLAVSSAITWFFDNVEEGIIIEDDCLPDISFFSFCGELLERYRENRQIMHISGDNFQYGRKRGNFSYYFSRYNHCWGWATWRRAWSYYDFNMAGLDDFIDLKLESTCLTRNEFFFWSKNFIDVKSKKIDTWDYQWIYAVWRNNGISILPNVNLVKNIGFSDEATHTKMASWRLKNIELSAIQSLTHPTMIAIDRTADLFTLQHHFFVSGSIVSAQLKAIYHFLKGNLRHLL